ncbi:hypothetical protein [Streptococcus gordonii]|jgi:phage protein|uniref:hypothetical protein n=1 Tax=Streptococcus gordonii TaxID=1302 RepID=UPI000779A3A7|nr:hypothetical protein [Streptococcus gordonii]QBX08321.1 hypothetical protein JavanS248_0005 [Streptococcus satellite phage Javan248]RSJ46169.1 hypothetical protein D8817_01325 [Streptococcus gordonii]
MATFSVEFERSLLDKVDKLAERKLELERELHNKTGLITAKELKDELDISGTTLNNWMREGLVSFQTPFENSKKLYFRVTDIINFLTVR